MITGESVICFAGEDWWYHHPHSKNHIMTRLARAGNRVMFVNSISMGLPAAGSPDLWGKLKRKLLSYAKLIRVTTDGVIVVSPPVLPFYSNRLGRILNKVMLKAEIKLLIIAFDLRNPILWIAIPTAGQLVGSLGERALIYQVSDKYEANRMDHATSGPLIAKMHQRLLHEADLVYYSGRKLYEEAVQAHPETASKSKLLEQAVDFDHFSRATSVEPIPVPPDIDALPRPRLGYFGAIESWLIDQNLVRYVSERRPEWQWVFIGLRAAALEIESLPNVHYLGSRPYRQMPNYAAAFQVCVLPWVTNNEFVSYGSAIKVREYLATGKPVVITPLYEYEPLDGILRIARSYDDFIHKVEDSLKQDTDPARLLRQQAVERNTWEARTNEVSDDIAALISRKSKGL